MELCRSNSPGNGGSGLINDAATRLEGSATPALARLISRAAAQQPYGVASRDLAEYGAIQVDERQIQRVVQRISKSARPL